MKTVELDLRGKKLTLETGLMAKQADGAVVARYGDTVVLADPMLMTDGASGGDEVRG